MGLEVSKANHGREWHVFERGGDRRSLCGRIPMTSDYSHLDLTQVTCPHCKRLLEIFERHRLTSAIVEVPAENGVAGADALVAKRAGRHGRKTAVKAVRRKSRSAKSPRGKKGARK